MNNMRYICACADLEGGSEGSGPPLEFPKLNIADITGNEKIVFDITGNEKISYFFILLHFHSYMSKRINLT